jgi:putative transposase
VSKSTVSREAAGEAALKELVERRFAGIDLLVIYLDGMQFGEHHVISAVGVDRAGHKHVLGMQQGATENAAAVEDLLEQLVVRGVDPKAKHLFVIDGAKALRAAINKVFGAQHPVQRCRNHKIRNLCDRLPEEQKDQVKAAMRASYKLEAKESMARRESWRTGWSRSVPLPRTVCGKDWRNVSPSTAWAFHRRCIAAWPRPT